MFSWSPFLPFTGFAIKDCLWFSSHADISISVDFFCTIVIGIVASPVDIC
jgi:hypothetical protein